MRPSALPNLIEAAGPQRRARLRRRGPVRDRPDLSAATSRRTSAPSIAALIVAPRAPATGPGPGRRRPVRAQGRPAGPARRARRADRLAADWRRARTAPGGTRAARPACSSAPRPSSPSSASCTRACSRRWTPTARCWPSRSCWTPCPSPRSKATKTKPALDLSPLMPLTRDFAFVVEDDRAGRRPGPRRRRAPTRR